MPYCNRVDPFGEIRIDPARGLFTGNRGIIHDPDSRTLLKRRWTTKAWIVCALEHPRGTRREVMGRNASTGGAGWTELFFLDEVTALAAGHRPCFFCRRVAARAFVDACRGALGRQSLSAPELDNLLHCERLASGGTAAGIDPGEAAALPDGTMLARDGEAFAVRNGRLLPWSFAGYGPSLPVDHFGGTALLLTPTTTVTALRAGYRAVWHDSAEA
jgi:hypothetical protein